jgi:hypothetical protein
MGEQDGPALRFEPGLPLGDAAEAALEDYARVLCRADSASVEREGRLVTGLCLTGACASLAADVVEDVERFARALSAPESNGLGWS